MQVIAGIVKANPAKRNTGNPGKDKFAFDGCSVFFLIALRPIFLPWVFLFSSDKYGGCTFNASIRVAMPLGWAPGKDSGAQ
jgi:hypothetical protein